MALTAANVPQWLDVDADVDVSGNNDFVVSTDIKADLVQLQESGGGYPGGEIGTADGSVFTGLGNKRAKTWTLRFVYSDGETTDLYETLKDAEGGDAAVRYAPKGTTGTNRTHTLTGQLMKVSDPVPEGNAAWSFTAEFWGSESYA